MLINYREHQRGVWSRSIDYLIDYIFLAKYRRDHLTFLSGYNIAYADIEYYFARAWWWHGTGRYQYRDTEKIDILESILQSGGLMPKPDNWDPRMGRIYSISTSPSRMYTRLYAELHAHEDEKIKNQYGSTRFWLTYFMGILARDYNKEYRPGITSALHGLREAKKWPAKVTTKTSPLFAAFKLGSDIKGNYPILIGIQKDAFREAEGSACFRRHERKSMTPITVDTFSHIEVPAIYVPETKKILKNHDYHKVAVIPIEGGEAFCSRFTFAQLREKKLA